MSLFQSNLRKQLRNLPKILEFCEKNSLLFKIIHFTPYPGVRRRRSCVPRRAAVNCIRKRLRDARTLQLGIAADTRVFSGRIGTENLFGSLNT